MSVLGSVGLPANKSNTCTPVLAVRSGHPPQIGSCSPPRQRKFLAPVGEGEGEGGEGGLEARRYHHTPLTPKGGRRTLSVSYAEGSLVKVSVSEVPLFRMLETMLKE